MPKTKTKPDPREEYLAANTSRHFGALPPGAIEDLKYFASAAPTRALTFPALQKWLREKHGISMGMQRLHRLAVEAGIKPWWKP
jgi:hypothetical protein